MIAISIAYLRDKPHPYALGSDVRGHCPDSDTAIELPDMHLSVEYPGESFYRLATRSNAAS